MDDVFEGLEVSAPLRPRPADYGYDLDLKLRSVVALQAEVPDDAFTAQTLGTERLGNGVVVRDNVVLTIGYLITEASEVFLTTWDGRSVPAHVLGVDAASGFGLVHALEPLDLPSIELGDSAGLADGMGVVVAGAGGRKHAVAATVAARREFAGYWEYVLDEAIFTAPAHPHWSGAALLDAHGRLVGVGSLHVEENAQGRAPLPLNMAVPIELLPPVFDTLLAGRATVSRPWLGLFAQEIENKLVCVGFAGEGPARRAEMNVGDIVLAVDGRRVKSLAAFYRAVWALGDAGVDVPLTLNREGDVFDVTVTSADRRKLLRTPRYH